MSKLPKRKQAWAKLREHNRNYPVLDALKIIKQAAVAKFDEAVDVAINLGIDAKKSDQTVRGSVVLPAGTGKKVRIAVFAQGDKAKAAKDAGADLVGMEDLAESVKAGKLDFDVVIASPDTMRVVGQLGQILGPRGLMPNPKVGTVTPDVAAAVKNARAGQVQYRADKSGIVQCSIGRAHFLPLPRQPRRAGRCGQQVEAFQREGNLPAQGVGLFDHGTGRAGGRGELWRRRDGAALNMDDRTLGHRAACTACGGLSKTVGTERFNRQEKSMLKRPSVLRRWRTPCRIFLSARSPWVPQVLATGGF